MSRLGPRGILVLGWIAFFVFAYPGQMTQDSLDQLVEARSGFYTDAHPAVMAALWGLVDRVVAGGVGLLVLQSVSFLAGTYLVLSRAMRPRRAAVAACAVLLYPPVLTVMSVIWKDCLMAGLLVLGTGLVLSHRRRVRVLALGCFWLAGALRYNGAAATLPLVVLLFEWNAGARWLHRYGLALGAWLAITLTGIGANAALTDQKMYIWQTSAVLDITGTVRYVDPPPSDDELRRELAGTELLVDHDIAATMRDVYTPRGWGPMLHPPTALWSIPTDGTVPSPPAQREAFARAWWSLVSAHPGAYLHHRWRVMLETVGWSRAPAMGAVQKRTVRDPAAFAGLGLPTGSSAIQDVWSRASTWLLEHTPFYRPWMYVLLALCLLGFCRGQRDVFALLASGIGLELTLFLLAPSRDYRYSHWMITATCVAAIMLIARRAQPLARDRSGELARPCGPRAVGDAFGGE